MPVTDLLPGFLVSLGAGAVVYGFQKVTEKDPMRELAELLSLPQPATTPGDLVEELRVMLGDPLPCPPSEGPPLPRGLVEALNLKWEGGLK